jgi:serine protease Do
MSYHPLNPGFGARKTILASVAALALVAAGSLGGSAVVTSSSASAAAVATGGLATQAAPSFARLIERVKPAVVSIKVNIVEDGNSRNTLSGQFDNLPPEIQQFLKQFGSPNGSTPPATVTLGEGSGFFISSDGYIVTNNHVVQNAKLVTVTMDDGKALDAKVIGTDPKTDLALIKVTQPGDYPYVSFAKETPRVGDWIVAIGNPYGLGGTATAGIISAQGRDIGDGPYDRFLQIDAPINKGNSGGPAFNMQGEVVGVNTAIYSPSGGSVGIGFAIPASTADNVVAALEHGGVVPRGYLGVEIQPVGHDIAQSLGLKSEAGAMVDKTVPGTPAADAGLKPGDVITELNGRSVTDAADLTRRIGSFKPGDKIKLTYLRDNLEKTAELTLAAQENEKVAKAETKGGQSQGAAVLGVEVAPASQVAGAGDKGVAIVSVDPNGAATEKGLKSGDVILDVAGKSVSTPEELKSEIAGARQEGKKAVLMRVQTANGDRFVAIPFPKA